MNHFPDLSADLADGIISVFLRDDYRQAVTRIHGNGHDAINARSSHNGKSEALQIIASEIFRT
jgi:hypothetical protein